MIKEIGSIFPLDGVYSPEQELSAEKGNQDVIFYSLCREALYEIAVLCGTANKKVLIPAYTCQTVISPFIEAGWSCAFYGIQRTLRIDVPSLEGLVDRTDPALVVVHPYFGMDLNKEETAALRRIREKGVMIAVDLTQCIFSRRYLDFVDFYVGSYRKWFPIPDGAFLKVCHGSSRLETPLTENAEFVTWQSDAMYLRARYFESGDQYIKAISIRLNKMADRVAEDDIRPHRMSGFSLRLKQLQDDRDIQKRRIDNYALLYDALKPGSGFEFVCGDMAGVTTAPLYFPIYVDDRKALQRVLAEAAVYAPVLWPVEDDAVLINDDVRYIYDHLLAIPCDQRYDEEDIRRIVEIINHSFCFE